MSAEARSSTRKGPRAVFPWALVRCAEYTPVGLGTKAKALSILVIPLVWSMRQVQRSLKQSAQARTAASAALTGKCRGAEVRNLICGAWQPRSALSLLLFYNRLSNSDVGKTDDA